MVNFHESMSLFRSRPIEIAIPRIEMIRRIRNLTSICGLLSTAVFVGSFCLFGFMNPNFDFASDFISKLGSNGQPYAYGWNLVGFGAVGLLLAAFGWLFGLCKNDRTLGTCLMVAGFGFAFAAIPADFAGAESPMSKAHFLSVCLSLAGYCCGLARLTGSQSPSDERVRASWVIAFSLVPIVCVSGGVSAEPVAHRIILVVVFSWIVVTSLRLLRTDNTQELAG